MASPCYYCNPNLSYIAQSSVEIRSSAEPSAKELENAALIDDPYAHYLISLTMPRPKPPAQRQVPSQILHYALSFGHHLINGIPTHVLPLYTTYSSPKNLTSNSSSPLILRSKKVHRTTAYPIKQIVFPQTNCVPIPHQKNPK